MRGLFSRKVNITALLFLGGIYLFWNTVAGQAGIFMPRVYDAAGLHSPVAQNMLQVLVWGCTVAATYFGFMRYADRMSQRLLYAIGAALGIAVGSCWWRSPTAGVPTMLAFAVLWGVSAGIGAQAFYGLWASELFATPYRASAQGVMFCVVRSFTGLLSYFFPTLLAVTGLTGVGLLLIGLLVVALVIGAVWAPQTRGKSLQRSNSSGMAPGRARRRTMVAGRTRHRDGGGSPMNLLDNVAIELPSWAFGNSGTRFKVFGTPGTPRTVEEKIADAATVHRFTGMAPTVALHIPWDRVDDYTALATHAAEHGVALGTINSNTFQDDDYKFGSLTHTDKTVRQKAIDHHLACIEIMNQTGSRDLKIWLADGTNYPGQGDIRSRQDRFAESLATIYQHIGEGQRMVLEYKFFEPAMYMTDVPDWVLPFAAGDGSGPDRGFRSVWVRSWRCAPLRPWPPSRRRTSSPVVHSSGNARRTAVRCASLTATRSKPYRSTADMLADVGVGEAGEVPAEQHLRVGVVGVHVLDDPGGGVDERVGRRGAVPRGVDPAHASVPTDVPQMADREPQEREVAEVDVVRRGRVGLEVALPRDGARVVVLDRRQQPEQRDPSARRAGRRPPAPARSRAGSPAGRAARSACARP